MHSKAFVLGGLATAASAHMLLGNPVPYGKSSLNNGPLAADGSDFPCKSRPGAFNAEGASNVYAQGSTQQLSFIGSAVHGGGSCQVSVTTDAQPDKNSVWKVIKSIEGGCPAQGQAGNMGDNAKAVVPTKIDYKIPESLASGNYTLAWTWFNKVGNREMYMNCAPLTVTGSGGSANFMDTLPPMFVANIGNGCGVPDGSDLTFPNPGEEIVRLNGKTDAFKGPTGGCGSTVAPTKKPTVPTGTGLPVPTVPTSIGVPVPTAAPSSAQPKVPDSGRSSSRSVPGGVFITMTTRDGSPSAPTQAPPAPGPVKPSTTAPAPAPPAPTSGKPGNGPGPAGGYAPGTRCTNDGWWNCTGGTSFQRCSSGMWFPVQEVAAGTQCSSGESESLEMKAVRVSKRTVRQARRLSP